MTQTPPKRLHIVEGSDWKDAVIVLLEPESAYCPWRHSLAEVSPGDSVAVILVTDPVSILTELAHSGDDDRLSDALYSAAAAINACRTAVTKTPSISGSISTRHAPNAEDVLSLGTFYGMPAREIPPWRHAGGRCVSEEAWYCGVCGHEW